RILHLNASQLTSDWPIRHVRYSYSSAKSVSRRCGLVNVNRPWWIERNRSIRHYPARPGNLVTTRSQSVTELLFSLEYVG
ncbi:hypothetical protein, partial [Moorena sp. SIO4A1]|uniref:hypothetical protein n=1 Tax=Moorena sp. SIO4A1 TaxID=2607835 RepID=UPI0025F4C576